MFFFENHFFECEAAVGHSGERNLKEGVCDDSKRAHGTAGRTHDWLVAFRVGGNLQAR